MPLRKALAALLLPTLFFLCLSAADVVAAPEARDRPSAALVASSESRLRSSSAVELTPLGLAALVAAGWVPALILLTRRRRQQRSGASH